MSPPFGRALSAGLRTPGMVTCFSAYIPTKKMPHPSNG